MEYQRIQLVSPSVAQDTSSFVKVKLAEHVLNWAHTTVKTTVCKNLEKPAEHFQKYGNFTGNIQIYISLQFSNQFMIVFIILQLTNIPGW